MKRNKKIHFSIRPGYRITQIQKLKRSFLVTVGISAALASAMYLLTQVFISKEALAVSNNYWTNSSGDENWSTPDNWSLGHVPTNTEIATFESCSGTRCYIDCNVNVAGINISFLYSGTILQGSSTVNIGTSGFVQTGGYYIGRSGALRINGGAFSIDNGTFYAPTGKMIFCGDYTASKTIFTHSGGYFDNNYGTIIVQPSITATTDIVLTFDVLTTTKLFNLTIDASSSYADVEINTAINETVMVENDLTHKNGKISGRIEFGGNLYVGSSADGGSGWLVISGGNVQKYSCDSTGRTAGLYIDKVGGSFFPDETINYMSCERMELVNGEFIAPEGNLKIGGEWNSAVTLLTVQNGATFTANGGTCILDPYLTEGADSVFTVDIAYDIEFYNLHLEGSGVDLIPLIKAGYGDTLSVNNDVFFDDGYSAAPVIVKGDVTVSASWDGGSGRLLFKGGGDQYLDCEGDGDKYNGDIIINKSGGKVILASDVTLDEDAQVLNFKKGILVSSANNLITLGDNFVVEGAGKSGFIQGPVRKRGNDLFEFPIGKCDSVYAPLRISAPSSVTDEFTAEYFRKDPGTSYSASLRAATIQSLSKTEYWSVERSSGTSDVYVELSFEDERSGGVNSSEDLLVASWNGSSWIDLGQGSLTGNNSEGAITAGEFPSDYSVFTLGSTTGNNPLPVSLVSFSAQRQNQMVLISWSTSAEVNNDYFTIERSEDGKDILEIAKVTGAGSSTILHNYTVEDNHPLSVLAYYRLRQTDFDGTTVYGNWKEVLPGTSALNFECSIYPNPSDGSRINVLFQCEINGELLADIYTVGGVNVAHCAVDVSKGQTLAEIEFAKQLAAGNYILSLRLGDKTASQKMQVK